MPPRSILPCRIRAEAPESRRNVRLVLVLSPRDRARVMENYFTRIFLKEKKGEKMKRIHGVLSVLLVAIFLIGAAGCASQPQADGPKTLRVLAMQQAGPTPDEMNAIVAKFNAANPNVTVEMAYVSYDALHDKIVTAMSTNPPAYDIVLVDDIWYAE